MKKGDGCRGFSIAIYPSASTARQGFIADTSRRSMMMSDLPHQKVGDQFLMSVVDAKMLRSAGVTGAVRSGGAVYMRKNNVLVRFGWIGNARGAFHHARKLEKALANPQVITVGRSLPLPAVNVSSPESVEIGDTVTIPYQVTDGTMVSTIGTMVSMIQEDFRKWGTAGEIRFSTSLGGNTFGKQKFDFSFITQDNRVIPMSCVVNIVPKRI